jgi:hypothetical protein
MFLLVLLAGSTQVHAYSRKQNKRGLPRTEAGLMDNFVGCLQNRDSTGYYNLFIPFDTLWSLVLHNRDRSPAAMNALNELKEHPQTLLEFDPHYNRSIIDRFREVIRKGEDSGIHWNAVTLQRYELKKQGATKPTTCWRLSVSRDTFLSGICWAAPIIVSASPRYRRWAGTSMAARSSTCWRLQP